MSSGDHDFPYYIELPGVDSVKGCQKQLNDRWTCTNHYGVMHLAARTNGRICAIWNDLGEEKDFESEYGHDAAADNAIRIFESEFPPVSDADVQDAAAKLAAIAKDLA